VTQPDWPRPGAAPAQKLEVLKAKLAWLNEQAKAHAARAQAEADTELDLLSEFHKALIEGARSGIDRSRASAETVQKAATGILALYTAVLGVSFSVADNPLPSRGVLPAMFLGLAVVFSTAYLAYLSKPRSVQAPAPQSSLRGAAMARTRTFIEWAGAPVSRRAYWLRGSVVSLGVALMFVPAPFLGGSLPYLDQAPWNEKKAETATTPSDRPPWPDVPEAGDNLALQRIRYTAEIAEATKDRANFKPAADPSFANQTWWLAAVAGALAIIIFPFIRFS
jgi:hypothetical protein